MWLLTSIAGFSCPVCFISEMQAWWSSVFVYSLLNPQCCNRASCVFALDIIWYNNWKDVCASLYHGHHDFLSSVPGAALVLDWNWIFRVVWILYPVVSSLSFNNQNFLNSLTLVIVCHTFTLLIAFHHYNILDKTVCVFGEIPLLWIWPPSVEVSTHIF